LSFENVFISLSSLKDIFIGYRIWGWLCFYFRTWKITFYCSLPSLFLMRSQSLFLLFLCMLCVLFPDCFKIFPLSLFSACWLWCVYIWFSLYWFCLGFSWHWICGLISFISSGKFLAIILSVFCPSLFSASETLLIYVKLFAIVL